MPPKQANAPQSSRAARALKPAAPEPTTAELRARAHATGLAVPDRRRSRPEIRQACHDTQAQCAAPCSQQRSTRTNPIRRHARGPARRQHPRRIGETYGDLCRYPEADAERFDQVEKQAIDLRLTNETEHEGVLRSARLHRRHFRRRWTWSYRRVARVVAAYSSVGSPAAHVPRT
jgi:hypothetical protein